MSIKLLHISDPHFGAHDETKCTALLSFAREWRPDLIAITGDLLNRPISWPGSAMARAVSFVDRIREICPNIFVVPGNHDSYLGGFFRDKILRKLQSSRNFVEYISIRGQAICLIGIDSTHFHLRHLNSSGRFDPKVQAILSSKIAQIKNRARVNFNETIKIVLVHHHPTPTISANVENMLYFKNSGQFLNFAKENNVRLILHGHQHDPHFTKIGFGSDDDNDLIGVLSAGSCAKNDGQSHVYSDCGHFYAINISRARCEIGSYYYHRNVDAFEQLDQYVLAEKVTPLRLIHINLDFTVTRQGGMKAVHTYGYTRRQDTHDVARCTIGVDDESDACEAEALNLQTRVNGVTVQPSWLQDQARSKQLEVPLGEGAVGEYVEVKIEYQWPSGFKSFLTTGKDRGVFTVRGISVESCKIRLADEDPMRHLSPLTIFCDKRVGLQQSELPGPFQEATIRNPRGLVTWQVYSIPAPL